MTTANGYPDPTPGSPEEDAAILAHLAEAGPAARKRLRSALAYLTQALASGGARVDWGGGQVSASGTLQAPYPIYPPEVQRLREALDGVRAVYPFDWTAWDGWRTYPDGPSLAAAPVADAVRMVTRTIRGERFFDGAIEGALRSGTLVAATQRIVDWLQ